MSNNCEYCDEPIVEEDNCEGSLANGVSLCYNCLGEWQIDNECDCESCADVECPQCGAIGEGGANHPHESNCPIICSINQCSAVSIRETYLTRLDDGLRIRMCYCQIHLDKIMIHSYDKPFVWGHDVWVWDSNHA